jgi:hypothetical protein
VEDLGPKDRLVRPGGPVSKKYLRFENIPVLHSSKRVQPFIIIYR